MLLPGGTYGVLCDGAQIGLQTVAEKLTAAPGETINLGEFDVTAKARPELKRTSAAKAREVKAEGAAKSEGGGRNAEMLGNGAAARNRSPSSLAGEGRGEGAQAKSEVGGRKSEMDATTAEKPQSTAAADRDSVKSTGKASGTQSDAAEAADEPINVHVHVVDSQNQPVANVRVLVARDWESGWRKRATSPEGKTNASGQFDIEFRKSQFAEQGKPQQWRHFDTIWVNPIDRPPACIGVADFDFQLDQELTVRLPADEPIEGRIVDLEGKPVVGARVEVRILQASKKDDLTEWAAALRRGTSMDVARSLDGPYFHLLAEEPRANFQTTTTSDGQFRITGVGRARLAELVLTGEHVVVAPIQVVTLPIEPITVEVGTPSFPESKKIFGSKFTFVAEPSQPIEGVVLDAKTGDPLAGVQVVSDAFAGNRIGGRDILKTVSDARGRYRLAGMPKGEGNRILAIPADGQPYFMCQFDVPAGPGFEVINFDLQLHPGVLIDGRVADRTTGEPIPDAEVRYLPWPENPHIGSLREFTSGSLPGPQDRYRTDADGRFHLVGLPGRGLIEVQNTGRPYPTGQGRREIADLPKREAFRKISQLFAPTELFPTALKEVRIDEHDKQVTADLAPGLGTITGTPPRRSRRTLAVGGRYSGTLAEAGGRQSNGKELWTKRSSDGTAAG